MYLLAGLGNPGPDYAAHRHNIGFQAIDLLLKHYGFSSSQKKFSAERSEGTVAGNRCIALKPQTFMNHSGRAVGETAAFYKIPPEKVLVFYDELDLIPGKLRIKQGGGSGGHNGIKDIERAIGPDFWRFRFGIGHPGHKDRVTSYVLHPFAKAELPVIEEMVENTIRHLPLFFEQGAEALMTKVAQEK